MTTLNWRTSSFSDGLQCVEVAAAGSGHVLMRHSQNPNGPSLGFTRAEMADFLQRAKAGELDDLA